MRLTRNHVMHSHMKTTVTAVLGHGLDIQDREPADPFDPNFPAQLYQISGAVIQGVDPPPLPLLAEPTPVAQYPPIPDLSGPNPVLPFPHGKKVVPPLPPQAPQPPPTPPPAQPAPVVRRMATTGRLNGNTPDIFDGTRSKSEDFLREFEILWEMNNTHDLFTEPYKHVMTALSYIRGPLVNEWVKDKVAETREKVNRAANPINKTDEVLWTDFLANFKAAYTDLAIK